MNERSSPNLLISPFFWFSTPLRRVSHYFPIIPPSPSPLMCLHLECPHSSVHSNPVQGLAPLRSPLGSPLTSASRTLWSKPHIHLEWWPYLKYHYCMWSWASHFRHSILGIVPKGNNAEAEKSHTCQRYTLEHWKEKKIFYFLKAHLNFLFLFIYLLVFGSTRPYLWHMASSVFVVACGVILVAVCELLVAACGI